MHATSTGSTSEPIEPIERATRRLAAVRTALLVLGAALGVGLAVELATGRHWQTPRQAVAWPALGLAVAGGVLVAARRAPRARLAALAAVGAAAVVGVVFHLSANHSAGPLDRDYALTWDTLPAWRQWWLAASGGVGPAPPLVPSTLALLAALMVLASACDPAVSDPASGARRRGAADQRATSS